MRLALPAYNKAKECKICLDKEETVVSAYILSFQTASQILKKNIGTWSIVKDELRIQLKDVLITIVIDLTNSKLTYGTIMTQLTQRYSPEKGTELFAEEIYQNLGLTFSNQNTESDLLFTLFLKLVEIFHARCGLQIYEVESENGEEQWEIALCNEGSKGWVGRNGLASNRFGEQIDIKEWSGLRPEKIATYFFGFNRFCGHYPSPLTIGSKDI